MLRNTDKNLKCVAHETSQNTVMKIKERLREEESDAMSKRKMDDRNEVSQ